MGQVTTDSIDEPAATDPESAVAGSTSSGVAQPPPTPGADITRALVCAFLVAGCIASPGSAPLLAPFVPALVAIRILRQRTGARRFLVAATVASLVAAVATTGGGPLELLLAGAVALLLVPALGVVHVRAALHDPVDAAEQPAWPEPRLRSGMSVAIAGWSATVALVAVLAWPAVGDLRSYATDAVDRVFASSLEACEQDEAGTSEELCALLEERRDAIHQVVADHGPALLGLLLAGFAWGAALTAHPIVLGRLRDSSRVRRMWRLRDLEVHWSSAYLVAIGLLGWLALEELDAGGGALEVAAVAAGSLGALLIATQGFGLVAWVLMQRPAPGWYRAFLVFVALVASGPALLLLFALGVLDLAVHLRRRAATPRPPSR